MLKPRDKYTLQNTSKKITDNRTVLMNGNQAKELFHHHISKWKPAKELFHHHIST